MKKTVCILIALACLVGAVLCARDLHAGEWIDLIGLPANTVGCVVWLILAREAE